MKNNLIAALTITLACASSASAAVITTVSIQDFSSELLAQFNRRAVHTIDGSGFEPNGAGTHSRDANGTMWLSDGTYQGGEDPIGAYDNSFIEFNLGGNYDLSSTIVWNYNETGNTNRGANNVTISVAESVGGTFTSLGNFVFTQAPNNDTTDFGQSIDLSGANNVLLVRFDITSNHGSNNNFVGLSEVRFTAIPEPSTALLGGLGLLALLRRRR